MSYYHKTELLAPAGKWDVLQKAAEAGADAIYVGGKKFNMRLLRSEFNFTDKELKDAVEFLHQNGKKLFVTVNNLYFDWEIEQLKDYLMFLQDIDVDALIIQDTAVLELCRDLQLKLPLHASVQMGIGSADAVKFLEDNGFSRVILSKNLSLQEIEDIYKKTNLDIEYFVHGDLCISHTGQCYMSSFVAGKSSNRGQCIKPCRWSYRLRDGFLNDEAPKYYLAHNDLCLYSHLLDLIEAGVSSFKIEGRMRSADYISHLVSKYRKALDEIAADPLTYKPDTDGLQELYDQRVRDFTAGNLLGKPGIESIGLSGEREPFFPTSAVKLTSLTAEDYQGLADDTAYGNYNTELSVKVGDIESFAKLCSLGVDNLIVGCEDTWRKDNIWRKQDIARAVEIAEKNGIKVFLETPRIMLQGEMGLVNDIAEIAGKINLHGIIVNDYGSLRLIREKGLSLRGGYGFNVTNSLAVEFLAANGVERITASQEIQMENLESMLKSGTEIEVMIHGPLCGIITDFCIAGALNGRREGDCAKYCLYGDYALRDEFDQEYLIRTDRNCRNYIFYPYDLCLFPYLAVLAAAGIKYMRIDGQYYDAETLTEVVKIYKEALEGLGQGKWEQESSFNRLLQLSPRGLTAGPLLAKP